MVTDVEILEMLKVISHPTRLEILRRINALQTEQGVTCSCVLEGMEISQSTFSHHISELSRVGLVQARSQSRFSMLSIDQEVWAEFERKLKTAIFA